MKKIDKWLYLTVKIFSILVLIGDTIIEIYKQTERGRQTSWLFINVGLDFKMAIPWNKSKWSERDLNPGPPDVQHPNH